MATHSVTETADAVLPHPCLRCGACCASYRVAFSWIETAPHTPDGIPEALTAQLDPQRVHMRGTDQSNPRCIVLSGTIGVDAHCGDYLRRPSPCHELQPAWENGLPSSQCERARLRHGLPPLQLEDWEDWRTQRALARTVPPA